MMINLITNLKEKFKINKKTSGPVAKSGNSTTPFCDEIATVKTVEGMYVFIKKMINPDEIIKKSPKGYAVLRMLENEGQIATCIDSRNAGVTSLNWQFTNLDEKYDGFYNKIFDYIDIYELIKDILKAPLYGFQPIEIIWTSKDGYIMPEEITAKPQEWFYYNVDNELCFNSKIHKEGLVITDEIKKFLVPRHGKSYLNPYGKSVLSRCFWDVTFKKGGMELWMKFAEKYGMPMLIAKYEKGDLNDGEINELLKSLENMVQDAVAAISNSANIDVINPDKNGSVDLYERIINICDKNISKNILGQTLTTDSDGKGSYALGQVHATVRKDIITADKRLVENQLNTLLRWIHELNFGTEDAPGFELYEEQDIDKNLAERDKILKDTGVNFTKKYFKKSYGLEDEDFEIATKPSATDFSEPQSSNKAKPLNHITAVDDLVNNFSDNELEGLVAPKIDVIIKEFSETQDPEQLQENLSILFPNLPSKAFEDEMAKIIFATELWGRARANEVDDVQK